MMSQRLSSYLDQCGARYDVCPHQHSHSSAETARLAHVSDHQLAKSVILEDDRGYVMAVIPADSRVQVGQLAKMLARPELHLSEEAKIAAMFSDCEPGAVPAFGMAWGVETVIDEELERNNEVYVEAGDHEMLVRMTRDQFCDLMRTAKHGHFSRPM